MSSVIVVADVVVMQIAVATVTMAIASPNVGRIVRGSVVLALSRLRRERYRSCESQVLGLFSPYRFVLEMIVPLGSTSKGISGATENSDGNGIVRGRARVAQRHQVENHQAPTHGANA